MRVLFLSQVLPYPLDAGPKVRAYYVLRHLARNYDVTLVSFVRDSDTPESIAHLEQFTTSVLTVKMTRSKVREVKALAKSALTGIPLLITRDEVAEMQQLLADHLKDNTYDVVHADQIWMAPYAQFVEQQQEGQNQPIQTVIDKHNAVFLVPQRMADASSNPAVKLLFKREERLMRRYEAKICTDFDKVVALTPDDCDSMLSLYSNGNAPARFPTIPICIDSNDSIPVSGVEDAKNVFFIGGMHWPPNADGVRWFVDTAWSQVHRQFPAAQFDAIGKNPPAAIHVAGVAAPGFVIDPEAYWQRARVFVVPLRAGGGMRVKILTAWAKGVPIVSTTIGAEGINYTDGKDILIADTPEAFVAAISKILMDDELATSLAREGRKTVSEQYDWNVIYPQWDAVYEHASS